MKSKHKNKIVHLALACLLLLTICPKPAAEAAVEVDPMIRVGLYFGSKTMSGANLLNSKGKGYKLGYFDEGRNFVRLAETDKTGISVVKTQNVYYGVVDNWAGYYDSIKSDILVGCYHLQLPGSYTVFEEAAAAAGAYPNGFVSWIDGTYYARVGAYGNKESALNAQTELGIEEAVVAGTSGYGVSVVETGTDRILFQFDSTGGLCLGIQPGLDDSVKSETIFRGNLYYGGFQYQRLSGNDMTVSNVLPLEDYVQGVIVREMSPSWPLEALKAQAVCARTYAYRKLSAHKHSSQGFDICNTVCCQAYSGISRMSDTSSRAVTETRGEYAWYDGRLVDTTYFSSDGGATEDAVNVWGNDIPYLTGKPDPYEALVEDRIPMYHWSITYTKQELTDLLNRKGYRNSGIVDFQVTRRTENGNVLEITFTDSNGKKFTKIKDACRTLLGLRSARYTVVAGDGGTSAGYSVAGGGTLDSMDGAYAVDGEGTVSALPGNNPLYVITAEGTGELGAAPSTSKDGSFTIQGMGWGHNVGMSQWGAYAMAKNGYTYDQILTFYYTGIEVREP